MVCWYTGAAGGCSRGSRGVSDGVEGDTVVVGADDSNPGSRVQGRRRSRWMWLSAVIVALLVIAGGFAAIAQPWTPEFRHGGLTVAPPPDTGQVFPELVPARADAPRARNAAMQGRTPLDDRNATMQGRTPLSRWT